MQPFHLSTIFLCYVSSLQPFVGCSSSHEEFTTQSNIHHKIIKENMKKLSPQMRSLITIHGVLLWVSMGFLMPLGILTIRFASYKEAGGRKARVLFYLHVVLQIVSVLLATIGAIMSIKSFENSFNNNHQRVGLALYGAMWLQALIGFIRPTPRESKRRSAWYSMHWIFGTTITLVSIVNIYIGLRAYEKKTLRSSRIWTILFTVQVSLMAFLYLLQDKWNKQRVNLGTNSASNDVVMVAQRENSSNQKVVVPEPCGKHNALQNLFD